MSIPGSFRSTIVPAGGGANAIDTRKSAPADDRRGDQSARSPRAGEVFTMPNPAGASVVYGLTVALPGETLEPPESVIPDALCSVYCDAAVAPGPGAFVKRCLLPALLCHVPTAQNAECLLNAAAAA